MRFPVSVDDRRNQVIVHLGLVASDALGNHHALFRRFVRQHGAANHVTDGVYARNAGGAIIVDEDETTLVHIDAGIGRQKIGGDRTTADRNDQLVEGHLLLAFGTGEVDSHLIALHFRSQSGARPAESSDPAWTGS